MVKGFVAGFNLDSPKPEHDKDIVHHLPSLAWEGTEGGSSQKTKALLTCKNYNSIVVYLTAIYI